MTAPAVEHNATWDVWEPYVPGDVFAEGAALFNEHTHP